MAFLIRTAYIPIGVKNYGMSLCDISFILFASTVAVVALPYSCVWSIVGNMINSATNADAETSKVKLGVSVVGSLVLIVTVVILGRYTQKAVAAMAQNAEHSEPADGADIVRVEDGK